MKKTTIILGIVVVVLVAGMVMFKSQSSPAVQQTQATPTATPTSSPTSNEYFEDAAGKIISLSPKKIVIQDTDGTMIDILLNDQVRYYDNSPRLPKEIPFSSFKTGEWIAVRGWANHPDPTKPAISVRAEGVLKSYPPGQRPDTGE